MYFKHNLMLIIATLFGCSYLAIAQSNIKYGPDYVVFEAEDANEPLSNKWAVRKKGDPGYLEYLFHQGESPDAMNDTYLEYVGPWQGTGPGTELKYKFICPKTGSYQIAMRLHCPLRETTHAKHVLKVDPRDGIQKKWEPGDLRNDCFIKMEGNFTKGNTTANPTQEDLETYHKFFGRGANKWGSNINMELHGRGNHGVIYNLIEGEEYTFYMKGRSTTAIVDYIAFYNTSYWVHNINNQSTDLALGLPIEIRPYEALTDLTITHPTAEVREDRTISLGIETTPVNANPSVTWSSSAPSIISVDADGKATAQGAIGEKAIITAVSTLDNSIVSTIELEIVAFFAVDVASVSVDLSKSVIIEGFNNSFASATVLPVEAENKNVTWSSADPSIATVDNSGTITGISAGKVIIRATSEENNSIFGEAEIEVAPQLAKKVILSEVKRIGFTDLAPDNQPNGETSDVDFEITLSGFSPDSQFQVFTQLDNLDDSQIAGKTLNIATNAYGIGVAKVDWSWWPAGTVSTDGGTVRWDANSSGESATRNIAYTVGKLSSDAFDQNSIISSKIFYDQKSETINTDGLEVLDIATYDLTGVIVSKEKELNHLPEGVYIVKVETTEGIGITKILK